MMATISDNGRADWTDETRRDERRFKANGLRKRRRLWTYSMFVSKAASPTKSAERSILGITLKLIHHMRFSKPRLLSLCLPLRSVLPDIAHRRVRATLMASCRIPHLVAIG